MYSQQQYYHHHYNRNTPAVRHGTALMYQQPHMPYPDDIEKDSKCHHPLATHQQYHVERDMKKTPTTPKSPLGNPGDRSRPVVSTGYVDQMDPTAMSRYTARGPHLQSLGGGSQMNSSLSSMSSTRTSSTSSSEMVGGAYVMGMRQYGMGTGMVRHAGYTNGVGMSPSYYGNGTSRARLSANQPVGYHQPSAVGQPTMRYSDNRTNYYSGGNQQGAPSQTVEMGGQFLRPDPKYRGRVYSTGSIGGDSSPPSHRHTHGYSSLGDRPAANYPSQTYYQPSQQVLSRYRHDYLQNPSYTRYSPHGPDYNAPRYTHPEPQYTHRTDGYDTFDDDNYPTDPQPMSLKAKEFVEEEEEQLSSSELSGQPVEYVSSQLSSLSLEYSSKQGNDRLQITEHPKDNRVALNKKITLSCEACVLDSEDDPNFLWYKDQDPLVGEINSELVIDNASEKDQGVYYCIVSHPHDDKLQMQSKPARISIKTKDGPEIIQQPDKYIQVAVGERLKIVLEVSGEPPLRYKWYKDTREMIYCTSSVMEISEASSSDSGSYCCTIADSQGSVLSDTFNVIVKPPTSIGTSSAQKQRPTSLHDWKDQPLTNSFLQEVGVTVAQQTRDLIRIGLYLGLTNTDVIEIKRNFYQPEEQAFKILYNWRENQRGSGTRSLLRTILTKAGINLDLMMSGKQFRQQMVRGAMPKILVQPQSINVIYGNEFQLSVQLEDHRHAEYQWYKNNTILSGKVDPIVYVRSAVESDYGQYHCVIKNQAGSVKSNIASVHVLIPESRVPLTGNMQHMPHPSSGQPWSSNGSRTRPSYSHGGLIGRGVPSYLEAAGQPIEQRKDQLKSKDSLDSLPRILEHPQSQDVESGDPLTLTCRAEHKGSPEDLGYLWYFNGLSMKDELRPQYYINFFTDEDEGVYACRVSNSLGNVTSNVAHVRIKADSD